MGEIDIFGYKIRLELIIAIIVLYCVVWGAALCSCSKVTTKEVKEGFSSLAENMQDKEISFSLAKAPAPNTSNWFTPDLTYSQGKMPDKGVQDILDRPAQPVPLPEGELDMFKTTEFKPECCPNAYSSSTGCACMTVNQYNYLIERGGNNVPYSQY